MAGREKWQFLFCDDLRGWQILFKQRVEGAIDADLTVASNYLEVRRLIEVEKKIFDAALVDLSLTGGMLRGVTCSSGAEVAEFLRMNEIPTALISEQTSGDLPLQIAQNVGVTLFDLDEELGRGVHETFLDIMNGVKPGMKPKNRRDFFKPTKTKVKFSKPRDGG